MYYVYFIKSINHDYHYIGHTQDLKTRLLYHNKGYSKATKPYAPFELVFYIAVKTRKHASDLEKYFKSGSGIAFSKKHLLVYK